MKIYDFLEEATKKWSKNIETKWEPKEGLFANGSAEEIARASKKGHKGDIGKAIKSLSFYINRAGENLSDTMKAKINYAKEILQNQNK
jgi:hypothetical protein